MPPDIRTVYFSTIFSSAILAGLFLSSCAGPSGPIPPVPEVSVQGVDPEVRDAVLEAHSKAEAEPDNAEASGRLGMILEAHTMYLPAEQAFRRAILLEPNEFAWKYYLGLTLREESKLDEALEAFTDALKLQPDYEPGIIQRGEVLFELGQLDESSQALESVLADDSTSAAALYAMARVKYAQGEPEEASDYYRRAARILPSFGAAYYGLGVTQQSMGNDAEAERNFELAAPRMGMANEPQEDPLRNDMMALRTGPLNRVKLAEQAIYAGNWDEAATLLREVLERDPKNVDALQTILYLGASTDRVPIQEMETDFEHAREVASENPDIYMYYATALANEGRGNEAMPWLEKSIELDPNYAEAHTLMASIFEQQKRNAQAIEHYRLALEAKPYHRPARLHLTKLLLNLGRYNEAIPELQQALEVDDQDTSMVMVSLGYAYLNTGEVGKAQEYFRHAQSRVKRTGPPQMLQQIELALRELGARP